jgi:hypothetical protein
VLLLGLGVCVGTVVLQLVTLPVEFDASNRARRMLVHSGMITAAEDPVVKRVLHAAVATHVATILMSTLTPRCFFIRTGLSGRGCEVDSRRSALPDAYGSMQDLVTQHDSEAGKRQT